MKHSGIQCRVWSLAFFLLALRSKLNGSLTRHSRGKRSKGYRIMRVRSRCSGGSLRGSRRGQSRACTASPASRGAHTHQGLSSRPPTLAGLPPQQSDWRPRLPTTASCPRGLAAARPGPTTQCSPQSSGSLEEESFTQCSEQ